MALGRFIHSPGERKRYEIDYSDWLDDGEVVSTVTFTSSTEDTGELVVDGVLASTDNLKSIFYVSGGDDGAVYTVVATMTSSNGQTKEDAIQYIVRAAG